MPFSAIMVLLWTYLMAIQFYLSVYGNLITGNLVAIIYGCYTLFPLIGLLTDVYIGRYRAITTGIILCFISWIINGILFILNNCYGFMEKMWILPGYVINNIGVITFAASVIQYNIDQLIGGSANELSTIIYWNIAALPVAWVLSDWLVLFNPVTREQVVIIPSGVALSLVLVSHSLFKHKLENISLIKNPIKLIVRVLCYARKHKYPENRSALTYWEEEAPSRLDLAKDKYGGPFTEEEVEDVKTFFRMLPLFIAILGFGLIANISDGDCTKESLVDCIMITFIDAYSVTIFIIRGCFHKYIPSMLTRMGAGIAFALLGCIFIIRGCFHKYIPSMLTRMGAGILFVAQSPEHMRGMMVGLCYTSLAGYAFNSVLQSYFKSLLHYYIIVCFLQLLILIVFVILARRYKYRIVDDHYQRYMEQEDEYERHQEIPESEIVIIED
uniref:Major facilitator superfamily (MFS) profile domain-containing protein n=1 Tax=Amphimedon queenslandica TaxID=400682 RepID=A0A1X7SYL0_AMPQE